MIEIGIHAYVAGLCSRRTVLFRLLTVPFQKESLEGDILGKPSCMPKVDNFILTGLSGLVGTRTLPLFLP